MACITSHSVHIRRRHGDCTLHLRPVSDLDIGLLCELNSDPRVLEWADDSDTGAEPYDEQDVRDIYGHVSQNALCFIAELDGVPVGDCWLQKMNLSDVIARYPPGTDVRRIDMSIGRVDYWNRGIGTAMVGMLVDYAFRSTKTEVLHCMCSSRNIRSSRVWQKNGFHLAQADFCSQYEQHYVLRRDEYLAKSIR